MTPERPSGAALVAALGGGPFRIGGAGEAPGEGFETLTSGSSGAPRRIARRVESWTASFAVNAGLFGIGPGVRVAVLGRLTQSLSLYGALEGMHLGAEVHLLEGLRPDRQALAIAVGEGAGRAAPPLLIPPPRRGEGGSAAVKAAPLGQGFGASPPPCGEGLGEGGRGGMHLVYATPAQMRLCCEAGVAWPELRHLVIGGSKLDAGLRARVKALAPGVRITEFYGAAEASFITLAGPDCPEASVGRAYPGVEIALEGGEIWVRSPYLFTGYAGDPGPAVWRDGWLSVGEMGEMRDGFLYLKGRAGRMVTVADQNVFPEEIEGFLLGLAGVRQAAVVPRADSKRGVHLVAVVQGDKGEEAALLRALRARLGPLLAPKRVVWLAEWPVLPSGKTDIRAIAAQVAG